MAVEFCPPMAFLGGCNGTPLSPFMGILQGGLLSLLTLHLSLFTWRMSQTLNWLKPGPTGVFSKKNPRDERGNCRTMAGAWESSGSISRFLELGGAQVPNSIRRWRLPWSAVERIEPYPLLLAVDFPGECLGFLVGSRRGSRCHCQSMGSSKKSLVALLLSWKAFLTVCWWNFFLRST